jgi:hypothetical protein
VERMGAVKITKVVIVTIVIAYVVPISLNPSILMMKAIISSETSALRKATRYHIPENSIPQKKYFIHQRR